MKIMLLLTLAVFSSQLSFIFWKVIFKLEKKLILFLLLFIGLTSYTYAEGSKELYIDDDNTRLFFCTDSTADCGIGGIRTQFAIYDCDEMDRLYFVTTSDAEIVYLGFNGIVIAGNKIVYRIKDINGECGRNLLH